SGRPSRSALVSLGNGRYLELLAPCGEASPSADIDVLRRLQDLTPLMWVVSTSQPEVTVRHLRQATSGTTGHVWPRCPPCRRFRAWVRSTSGCPARHGARPPTGRCRSGDSGPRWPGQEHL